MWTPWDGDGGADNTTFDTVLAPGARLALTSSTPRRAASDLPGRGHYGLVHGGTAYRERSGLHMKTVVAYANTDGCGSIRVEDVANVRAPGRGQVVIDVTHFPIHRSDLQQIAEGTPDASPRPVGIEATGVVQAVGNGVERLREGMRVSVFPHRGTWAQRILVDAGAVLPVPDSVPDEVAAQMLVNPLTMLLLRREADKHFSTTYDGILLNNAADDPVGTLLTAGLSHHSIPTISLARSAESAQRLATRFPDVPVVTTEDGGWTARVRALTEGRTVGVGFDPEGGRTAANLVDLLSPGGTLVLYGRHSSDTIPIHASALHTRSITLRGINVESWTTDTSPRRRASDINTAMAVATLLTNQFDTAATYPLTALEDAIAHASSPETVGTVLVQP